MAADKLYISILQQDIIWEDKNANYRQYEEKIASIKGKKEILVLPEMFNTGFSMRPESLAEPMDGAAVRWMQNIASQHKCILTGSVMIEENGHYYNRMIWMLPNGQFHHYDKKHLFSYANEHQHYTAGDKRVIVSVNGWKICLMVCYDLRFPVWLRNQNQEYDVLIIVANWPERRSPAWKNLLQARAIENMSYVVGVNRVGNDGNDIYHSGDSAVYDPLGKCLWENAHEEVTHTEELDKNFLMASREQFPFLEDADRFLLL